MTEEMIIEAVRSAQISPRMVEPTGVVSPVADPETVARFSQAMAPAQVEAVPFADKVAASWQSAQDNHQGIVHRIQALSEMSGRHALSAAELTELQYEVHNLAFQQEVVAKVADKSSSAIQSLVRNQ
ncbi:MAG: hypothetical protein J6V91_02380 [Kiritimatiellae bacterium]|jgi:hypothetical protein|nr:hypothetical protein [Kiritimatiellia bacterium]